MRSYDGGRSLVRSFRRGARSSHRAPLNHGCPVGDPAVACNVLSKRRERRSDFVLDGMTTASGIPQEDSEADVDMEADEGRCSDRRSTYIRRRRAGGRRGALESSDEAANPQGRRRRQCHGRASRCFANSGSRRTWLTLGLMEHGVFSSLPTGHADEMTEADRIRKLQGAHGDARWWFQKLKSTLFSCSDSYVTRRGVTVYRKGGPPSSYEGRWFPSADTYGVDADAFEAATVLGTSGGDGVYADDAQGTSKRERGGYDDRHDAHRRERGRRAARARRVPRIRRDGAPAWNGRRVVGPHVHAW